MALGVRGARQRPPLDGAAFCASGLVISWVRHLRVWLILTAALREKEGGPRLVWSPVPAPAKPRGPWGPGSGHWLCHPRRI